ncbi:hypothetical protein WCV21_00840 [Lactobacillus helveticus]|uniref:hypothetical protein n=1 Tax=Lactobacillus helveticus TaxID=1587 RepID=UPI0015E8DC9C|nr:hypothetical protein [Lactobacillus helveticus]
MKLRNACRNGGLFLISFVLLDEQSLSFVIKAMTEDNYCFTLSKNSYILLFASV